MAVELIFCKAAENLSPTGDLQLSGWRMTRKLVWAGEQQRCPWGGQVHRAGAMHRKAANPDAALTTEQVRAGWADQTFRRVSGQE